MSDIKAQLYTHSQSRHGDRYKAAIDDGPMDTSPEAVKARINEAFDAMNTGKDEKSAKKAADIARECGANPQTINNWFNTGKVSRENSVPLAKALDCSTDWLLAGVGPRSRHHGPVNKPRLRRAVGELFFAARRSNFDLAHIPPHRCANIIALAYDILGEGDTHEEESLRIVRRVIESMIEQAGVASAEDRGATE